MFRRGIERSRCRPRSRRSPHRASPLRGRGARRGATPSTRPRRPQQQHVVVVDEGGVGGVAMALPHRSGIEDVSASLRTGMPGNPRNQTKRSVASRSRNWPITCMPTASCGLDELAFEQVDQFIAAAGLRRVLAQFDHAHRRAQAARPRRCGGTTCASWFPRCAVVVRERLLPVRGVGADLAPDEADPHRPAFVFERGRGRCPTPSVERRRPSAASRTPSWLPAQ